MALPKSFADDGAFGAQASGIVGAPPAPSPFSTPSGSGFDSPALPYTGAIGNQGGFDSDPNPGAFNGANNTAPMDSAPSGGGLSPAPSGGFGGGGFDSFPSNSGGGMSPAGGAAPASPVGLAFEDGGAVEGDDSNGSPQQDAISKALDTVDQVLAFGRKQHGLGGDDESGGIQMAANTRMPAQPPSQSESGVKPIQPMPGPLPPTSNPFGKRADAGNDNDQDDQPQSGGIDTDEDTA